MPKAPTRKFVAALWPWTVNGGLRLFHRGAQPELVAEVLGCSGSHIAAPS